MLRVWRLGRNHLHRLIPKAVTVVVASGYAVGIVLAVFSFREHFYTNPWRISWAIKLAFSVSIITDFVISGAMIYYLQKSRSDFTSTNSKLASLIQYVIASGLLTSACSLASLIAYLAMQDNLVFLAIGFSLTKIYINSFLAMLNSRHRIHGKDVSISLTERRSGSACAGPDAFSQSIPIGVHKHIGIQETPHDETQAARGEKKIALMWPHTIAIEPA